MCIFFLIFVGRNISSNLQSGVHRTVSRCRKEMSEATLYLLSTSKARMMVFGFTRIWHPGWLTLHINLVCPWAHHSPHRKGEKTAGGCPWLEGHMAGPRFTLSEWTRGLPSTFKEAADWSYCHWCLGAHRGHSSLPIGGCWPYWEVKTVKYYSQVQQEVNQKQLELVGQLFEMWVYIYFH